MAALFPTNKEVVKEQLGVSCEPGGAVCNATNSAGSGRTPTIIIRIDKPLFLRGPRSAIDSLKRGGFQSSYSGKSS